MKLVYPNPISICDPKCPERTPTCHVTCRRYKIESHKRRLMKRKIFEIYLRENALDSYEIQRSKKIKERKKHS